MTAEEKLELRMRMSRDFKQGFEAGRAEAIRKYHKAVENNLLNATFDVIINDEIAKNLKEQKND